MNVEVDDLSPALVGGRERHLHEPRLRARAGERRRVVEELPNERIQSPADAKHEVRAARFGGEPDARIARILREARDRGAQEVCQIDALAILARHARLRPREVEEMADERVELRGARAEGAGESLAARVGQRGLERLGHGRDGGDRALHLVHHVGDERLVLGAPPRERAEERIERRGEVPHLVGVFGEVCVGALGAGFFERLPPEPRDRRGHPSRSPEAQRHRQRCGHERESQQDAAHEVDLLDGARRALVDVHHPRAALAVVRGPRGVAHAEAIARAVDVETARERVGDLGPREDGGDGVVVSRSVVGAGEEEERLDRVHGVAGIVAVDVERALHPHPRDDADPRPVLLGDRDHPRLGRAIGGLHVECHGVGGVEGLTPQRLGHRALDLAHDEHEEWERQARERHGEEHAQAQRVARRLAENVVSPTHVRSR